MKNIATARQRKNGTFVYEVDTALDLIHGYSVQTLIAYYKSGALRLIKRVYHNGKTQETMSLLGRYTFDEAMIRIKRRLKDER